MITIIFLIMSLAVAIKVFHSLSQRFEKITPGTIILSILAMVAGIILSLVQPLAVERVDAGNVGIKVKMTGDSRGISKYEYKTGWVIVNEWTERLYEFPTFQQSVEYPVQEVITKGGFPATIHPTFNYTLIAGNIGDMFSNLRIPLPSVQEGWLKTAIVGSVNDVANLWTVDDIFNHRAKFEADIVIEANKRVQRWFNISQLRTGIKPPAALVDAINKKTQAIQDVQVAENRKQVAIAEGDTKVATARADSAQAVIQAAGEAEAIRRKQLTLTPIYVEYMKIEKWDGQLPQVQGTGGGIMLNMSKK